MKQRNIPWLGAVVDSVYITLPILSAVNFFAILTVLYTNISSDIQAYVPWMRYWVFLILVGILSVILMVLVYKFVVPSLWAFRGKQMFMHESEITDKLDELLKKVDELEKKEK